MASEVQSRVQLRAAMLTDVGVVRDHNEDAAHVDPEHHFFIVADGMGGHAAGEVASAMAVDNVRDALDQARDEIVAFSTQPDEERRKVLVKVLENAVRSAHQSVYERGTRETDKQGMGTTLDVVLVAGQEAFVAHVGDSRTYLIREGKAAQITTDHTVAEVLVIEGKLSLEEAQISPLRTILVNAIGVAPDVGIEMAHVQLRKGDLLLLCSDGLHDYFPDEKELANHLTENSPDEALGKLINMAKERGGHDNITGIVVDVQQCERLTLITGDDEDDFNEITMSDGVPAHVERDDTLPVDLGDDKSSGSRSTRNKKAKKKSRRRRKGKRPGSAIEAMRATDPVMEAVTPVPRDDGDSSADRPFDPDDTLDQIEVVSETGEDASAAGNAAGGSAGDRQRGEAPEPKPSSEAETRPYVKPASEAKTKPLVKPSSRTGKDTSSDPAAGADKDTSSDPAAGADTGPETDANTTSGPDPTEADTRPTRAAAGADQDDGPKDSDD